MVDVALRFCEGTEFVADDPASYIMVFTRNNRKILLHAGANHAWDISSP